MLVRFNILYEKIILRHSSSDSQKHFAIISRGLNYGTNFINKEYGINV